jgi:hypothetical protein
MSGCVQRKYDTARRTAYIEVLRGTAATISLPQRTASILIATACDLFRRFSTITKKPAVSWGNWILTILPIYYSASLIEFWPHRSSKSSLSSNDPVKENQTPWPESASELYRPSDLRLSVKLVPTFDDWGCHVAVFSASRLMIRYQK